MQTASQHGVYEAETVEEVARFERAHASVRLCLCDDQLFRYAVDLHYSHGGFCGPISIHGTGYATMSAAREEGIAELARRVMPHGFNSTRPAS